MIVNTRGPVSYIVKLSDGCHIKHHVDHLRNTEITVTDQATDSEVADDYIPIYPPTTVSDSTQPRNTEQPELPCRSARLRTAPDRLTYPQTDMHYIFDGKECDKL